MAIKTENTRSVRPNKGRVITFLVCLFVSAFFWSLMTLSKEYSVTEYFPVQYKNIPTDKVVSSNLPETIGVEIKAKGLGLMAYKFRRRHEMITLDIKDAKPFGREKVYYIATNDQLDKIKSQFNKETHVLKVNPDTIFINFNKKVKRMVPVKSNLILHFNKLYNLMDCVMIQPKFITVSAEAGVLNKIDFIETRPLVLENLSAPTTVKLELIKKEEYKHAEFSQPTVKAIVNVTKFTEASMEIPVEVDNLPPGYSFKTFPDKVMVKFNVAFEDYEKINASSFRAVVDYKKIDKESNKLKVQILKVPDGVRNVKLVTDRVEYIISK